MTLVFQILLILLALGIAVYVFISKGKRSIKIAGVLASILSILSTIFVPAMTVNNAGTIVFGIVNIYESKDENPTTVPEETEQTTVKLSVRNLENPAEQDTWFSSVIGNEGDIVRFKVTYTNKSDHLQNDALVFIQWSDFLEYIPGSTMLYNSNYPHGIKLDSDGLKDETGINIGNYESGASGVVTFEARILSGVPTGGTNLFRNWAQIYVNDLTPELGKDFVQDSADVLVMKKE